MVQEHVGWLRLWDSVMDNGVQHTRSLQMLSRLMSHHGRGEHPCPLCEASDLTSTVLEHVLLAHRAEMGIRVETNSELLIEDLSTSHISFVAKFRNLFDHALCQSPIFTVQLCTYSYSYSYSHNILS